MFVIVYDGDNYHIGQGGHEDIDVRETFKEAKEVAEFCKNAFTAVTVYKIKEGLNEIVAIHEGGSWWFSSEEYKNE
ncbi:hypothetical protein [Vibrio phage vB_VpaP_SJSY21]|nr:hypothetical protein [Vibrio phage vB_VpaP_SJSY21]